MFISFGLLWPLMHIMGLDNILHLLSQHGLHIFILTNNSFLKVRWDDDVDFRRPNRISPWEIELTSSVSGSHMSAPNAKRLKPCLPHVNPDYLVPSMSVLIKKLSI